MLLTPFQRFQIGTSQFLLFIVSIITSFSAHSSLEAVELELIPSDILVNCNRSFFKSSTNHTNAIFVTPHVVAGRSPIADSQEEVHIETTGNPGEYLMSVGVFFPRDAGDNANFYEMRDAQANFCNFESVKHFINQSSDIQYDSIVHLPLTSVEITIPGIESKAHIIGRIRKADDTEDEEVDILEYNDKSYTAEFILNDAQLDYVNSHMSKDEGLQLDVKYRFQARKNDGSVSVSLDVRQLSANFQAAVQGKKFLAKGELKTHLATAVANTDIEISEKAGRSEIFNETSQKIISQVLSSVKFETKPPQISQEELESKQGKELVSVAVVIEAMNSRLSQDFSYTRVSAPEKTTAETSVRVRHSAIDPRLRLITINDGFNPQVFPRYIRKGHTIKITPGYEFMAERIWNEKKSYATVNQLEQLEVYNHYPEISDMSLVNEEIHGTLLAIGRKCWFKGFCIHPWQDRYRWKRIQRYPVKVHRSAYVHYVIEQIEDLKEVRLLLSFSQLGGSFHKFTPFSLFDETNNEYWDVKLELGTIVLKAKKDLGHLTIRDRLTRTYIPVAERERPEFKSNKIKLFKYDDKRNYADKLINIYVTEKVALDEIRQEYHIGKELEDDDIQIDFKPIKGRVDNSAIKHYKGIQLAITNPEFIPEEPVTAKEIKNALEESKKPNLPHGIDAIMTKPR